MALRLLALFAIAIGPVLFRVQTKRRDRLAIGGEPHVREVADEAAQLKGVGLHGMVPFSPFGDCWLIMARQHQTGRGSSQNLSLFGTPEGSAQGAPSAKVIHFDGRRLSGRVQRHGRAAVRWREGTPRQETDVEVATSGRPPWRFNPHRHMEMRCAPQDRGLHMERMYALVAPSIGACGL